MKLLLIGAFGRMGKALRETRPRGVRIEYLGRLDEDPDLTRGWDGIMDFSGAQGFRRGLRLALKARCRFFSGSTGLSSQDLRSLRQASKQILCCHTPNTSVQLLELQSVLERWPQRKMAQIRIREIHHVHKKDYPSGTSLLLAKSLNFDSAKIQSQRVENHVGTHELVLDFGLERLLFRHEVLDRRLFAEGAWKIFLRLSLQKKRMGLMTAQDLLKDE
ncbi:MAG: dihydrodipicolinate reductase C-terminal domain-containing protein [Bdellovibrio sp.]